MSSPDDEATNLANESLAPSSFFDDQQDENPSAHAPVDQATGKWVHYALWERVRDALYALPTYFELQGGLPPVAASDLHALNTFLGAVIEDHIPKTLNQIRKVWDPDSEYSDYEFRRQPQNFPDVIFCREAAGRVDVLFGIEIKGWYVLASEAEPSFRINVNRDFCHPADLVALYPWALQSAVAGMPKLFRPFVLGARKAARIREESWLRKAKDEDWKKIDKPAPGTASFHPAREKSNDFCPRDKGNNMGRLARTGVWDADIEAVSRELLAGIPVTAWQRFLKAFTASNSLDDALAAIGRIKTERAPLEDLAEILGRSGSDLISLAEQVGQIASILEAKRKRKPKVS